jgi:hypothetical protein
MKYYTTFTSSKILTTKKSEVHLNFPPCIGLLRLSTPGKNKLNRRKLI